MVLSWVSKMGYRSEKSSAYLRAVMKDLTLVLLKVQAMAMMSVNQRA